jgi:hypothetical protein
VTVATSAAPVVNSPIYAGATSVSGTSSENDGTTIEVFVNLVSAGTTTVSGGTWTKSGLTALVFGDSVTATATASAKCTSASSAAVTVIKRPTTITYTGPIFGLFGTCFPVSATLIDTVSKSGLSGETVTFNIAGNTATATTDPNGIATATIALSSAPANLPATVTASASFAGDAIEAASTSSAVNNFTYNPHVVGPPPSSQAVYTGQDVFWTPTASSSSASLALSATISDNNNDCTFNITKATITFLASPTGAAGSWTTLAGPLPVGLVTPGNYQVGTAAATVQYNIGSANDTCFYLAIRVGGDCTLSPSIEIHPVSVTRPVAGIICGTGTLDNNNATGLLPAFQPGIGNCVVSLGVQYTKSGSNPQGSVSMILTSGGKVYAIKSTSISTLSVNLTGQPTGNFSSKAVIQDITNPNSVISIDGGALLQVIVYKGTSTSNPVGQLGISVQNTKTGGMWYSSDWTGTTTIQKPVIGNSDSLIVQ